MAPHYIKTDGSTLYLETTDLDMTTDGSNILYVPDPIPFTLYSWYNDCGVSGDCRCPTWLTNQVLESDEFGETSLIILSTRGSGEEIDLQEGSTIIVSTYLVSLGSLVTCIEYLVSLPSYDNMWSPRKRQQALMTTRRTLLKSREKKQSLDVLVCSAVSQTEVPAPDVSSVKHSEERVAE
ncbi:unnamed protein product [Timema podura]|uniref:Uncharacterized protein n=1 Tax=Timema podura TaxID=61482 RepID=A0ABN7NRP8_TIMPD|nr:unnamed protein product [Timema podura]